MNPSEARTRLNDYLDGDLPAAERGQLERALAAHAELRAELAELRATVALLQRLRDPEVPPFLAERVIARVRAGEAAPESWWRRLGRRLQPSVGLPLAAGLAGLALFAGAQRGVLPLPGWEPAPAVPASAVASRAPSPAAGAQVPLAVARELSVPLAASAFEAPLLSGLPIAADVFEAASSPATRHVLDPEGEFVREMRIQKGRHSLALELARRGHTEHVARMLRGAGHPHAASMASHFDEAAHPEIAFADFSPGRRRR